MDEKPDQAADRHDLELERQRLCDRHAGDDLYARSACWHGHRNARDRARLLTHGCTKKAQRVGWSGPVIAVLVLCIGAELVYWFRPPRPFPGADVSAPEWVEQDILPLNPYSRPGTPLETIDGVVVHYVGNPGTSAAANRSFFANLALTHETYASAHFVVGLEGEVLQCVPLSEVAYCSSQANDHTVSIEVCHADETGEFSAETMASLLRLTAWLCEEFDLAPADVIRHYDVTGKICPKYYVDHPEAWEDFRSALRAARTQENPS